MTNLGFERPFYILSFDQRSSFQKMFGWEDPLTPEQTAEIAEAKRVMYDAFLAAIHADVLNDEGGVLVDEQFGASILQDALREGHSIVCPAEKSGQDEFDFEYGEDFGAHIKALQPSFCKVLVRYNPRGDQSLNQRQSAGLKRLSEYLHSDQSLSRFMLELLVPAEMDVRPELTAQAIQQLQDAGVEPDVWSIEGLDRQEDNQKIVAAARRQGRDGVSCMILLPDKEDDQVRKWLTTAATVPGFIGFAAGPASFSNQLVSWRAKTITRADAVAGIARRYHELAGIFQGRGDQSDHHTAEMRG